MDTFAAIRGDPLVGKLVELLRGGNTPVAAEGVWGSCAPILAAVVAEKLGRPLLLVCAHSDEADDFRDDIETATGTLPDLLPALESLPGETGPDDELASERLRLCVALSEAAPAPRSRVIVASIQALMQPVPSREAIAANSRQLSVGATLSPDALAAWLAERGYSRSDQVEVPGDFAWRGGIIDIFSHAYSDPVRMEFFGDDIESIRLFDAATQRSSEKLESVRLPAITTSPLLSVSRAATGAASSLAAAMSGADGLRTTGRPDAGSAEARHASAASLTTGFTSYLPADALVAFNEPVEIQELGRTYWQRLGEPAGFIPADAIFRRAADFSQLHLLRFGGGGYVHSLALDVGSLPQFDARGGDTLSALAELTAENRVIVLCDTEPERQHFVEMLATPEAEPESTESEPGPEENRIGKSPTNGFPGARGIIPGAGRNLPSDKRRPELSKNRRKSPAPSSASRTLRIRPGSAGGEDSSVAPLPRNDGGSETSEQADAAHGAGRLDGAGGLERGGRIHGAGRSSNAEVPAREFGISRPELSRVETVVGVIHRGFRWRKTCYVPHHELFGRYRQRRTLRRVAPARPIDSFFDLNPGDYVVHVMHGIGRFAGLKSLAKDSREAAEAGSRAATETVEPGGGRGQEYLAIEFSGGATVHVPVSQIDLVQKYVGAAKARPILSKLGGTAWKRTKERVSEAVNDLAADLLAVQARRATEEGIAYPRDTTWQQEFEGSFIYEETADQLRALEELKGDMVRPRPMDRLLCGDVGFGKTELAMRAGFKVVEYGKQVALLVPTTVLAEQHFLTFTERMADYPFKIEVLSRFRTKAEQKRIAEAARKGQVDILIGTHRLLSGDVRFADLGLVIIDEEQRFGVEAKERLKRLRATVDVLTMTATPIPRTLHMAMLGVKDISALATPPLDRRAIVTQVRMWEDRLIRDAILRELNRDGQVYFVHNFVRDIHAIADRIRTLVPEARIVIGHGQMNEHELEDVMLRFMRREADVLVCTSIIESGIDIPSANTIFINRAERFGLAELHQLRGRVGRSKHRAYAYLLLSPKHAVNPNAAKRLKAIEHYSHVGAGFQIAMRDLEIRGAGNILGPEQSGHIEAVGYEMYCQLLDKAVKRMKNEPVRPDVRVNLDLGITASIPRAYIRSERQRMEVYKRLAAAATPADIEVIEHDLRDAFGPLPPAVQTLLALAEIRVLAAEWGIRSIVVQPPDVVFSIESPGKADALFSSGPGSPRMPDPNTVHWRLPARYLESSTLLTILRRQLSAARRQPPATAG